MQEETKELTLLDYWNLFYKSRKLIISVTGVVTVLALVVTLLMPKMYTASVSVLPPELEDISKGGSMFNRNMFSPYSEMIDGGYNYSNFMIALLKSKRMAKDVAVKFKIKKEKSEDSSEEAEKELKSIMDITTSKEKVLTLNVTSRDPKLSADIANFCIENLENINAELQITPAKPFVRVLDRATPPKKKSAPSIRKNTAVGFIVSLFCCFLFVVLKEKYKDLKI